MGANFGMAGWYSSIEQYKFRIYTNNNITTTNSIKYTKMHLVKAVMCFFGPYWLAWQQRLELLRYRVRCLPMTRD